MLSNSEMEAIFDRCVEHKTSPAFDEFLDIMVTHSARIAELEAQLAAITAEYDRLRGKRPPGTKGYHDVEEFYQEQE